MKKAVFMTLILLFLVGCGNNYSLHDDFEMDLTQVLEVLDEAFDENRRTEDDERELVEAFINKYEIGQFKTDNGVYEMNDLEKEIVSEVSYMSLFTDLKKTLPSEKSIYEESRGKVSNYIDELSIPEDIVGKHKTYEIRDERIHAVLKEDTKEIIETFEELVNGDEYDVWPSHLSKLDNYIKEYDNRDFEEDGKDYLLTSDESTAILMANNLKEDLEDEVISTDTVDKFNLVKTVFGIE